MGLLCRKLEAWVDSLKVPLLPSLLEADTFFGDRSLLSSVSLLQTMKVVVPPHPRALSACTLSQLHPAPGESHKNPRVTPCNSLPENLSAVIRSPTPSGVLFYILCRFLSCLGRGSEWGMIFQNHCRKQNQQLPSTFRTALCTNLNSV